MHAKIGRLQASGLVAATLVAMLPLANGIAAEPAATETGRWQRHELRFHYMGFTTIYSCDGLATKLQLLLKLAGAREDAKASTGPCTELGGRPDRFASAKLVFHTLSPAEAGKADETVASQWRKVRIADRRPLDLAPGDCELVEQFRDEVLKKHFTTRGVVDRLNCVPHQVDNAYSYEYELLSPVPTRR